MKHGCFKDPGLSLSTGFLAGPMVLWTYFTGQPVTRSHTPEPVTPSDAIMRIIDTVDTTHHARR